MKEEPIGKYAHGDIVYSKKYPNVRLKVRRYVSRIYYCQFMDNPDQKELALFERELVDIQESSLIK